MKIWTSLILIVVLIQGISSSTLFDLDPSDGNNSSNGTDVFFTEQSQYFITNTSSYYYNSNTECVAIHAVVIGDDSGAFFSFNFVEALNDGRLPENLAETDVMQNSLSMEDKSQLQALLYFNGSSIEGRSFSLGVLNKTSNKISEFIKGVFDGLMFHVNEENFEKRLACIIAKDVNDIYTIGCVNVTFIGTNENPVELQYFPSEEKRVFYEGSDPIPVLNGNLTVTHDDHPTFLLQRIEVRLMHADSNHEVLGLLGSEVAYEDGALEIIVEDDTDYYKQLMLNVTYFNSNPEPVNENRTIIFTVFDGFTQGTELNVVITVENTNDETVIGFSDEKLTQYKEGSGLQFVDSGLNITDEDTNPHIESITIELMEVDSGEEYIQLSSIQNIVQINHTSQSTIYLYGTADLLDYTTILRSLQYLHNDSNPGNPTPGERTIQYIINDGRGNTNNQFKFNVSQVNDAPILSFVDDASRDSLVLNGDVEKVATYVEDGPSEYVMSDIYLRDVDSSISSVSILFHNFGSNDHYSFNESLLNNYNITLNEGNGEIILSGLASAVDYEKVLQSFAYSNGIKDDSILDEGNKTVLVTANDTSNAVSDSVEIVIILKVVDDLPELIVNDVIEFTEGSRSVEIATPAVISLMDEEDDLIDRLQILLKARNGDIDDKDTLVYLSNKLTPAVITRTIITYDAPGSIDNVEEFLRSIRYINQEDEPTYIDEGRDELLQRYIEIRITPADKNETLVYNIPINITLINDEQPLIAVNLNNSTCNASHPTVESSKYSKRDIHSFKRLRSKLYAKGRSNVHGLAPTVEVAYSQPTELSSSMSNCINNITIVFSSDTNTPPVEVRRDVLDIVSLIPVQLNNGISHGLWMGLNTVVIYLTGCYHADLTELGVMFETKGAADCNHTSVCDDGICFSNGTGCPIIGFTSVLSNYTPPSSTDSPSVLFFSHGCLMWSMVGVFIIALLVIIASSYASKRTKPISLFELKTTSKSNEVNFSKKVQTLLPQHCDERSRILAKKRDIPDDVVVIPKVDGSEPTTTKAGDTTKDKVVRETIEDLRADDSKPSNNSNDMNHQDSSYNNHKEVEQVRTLKQIGLTDS